MGSGASTFQSKKRTRSPRDLGDDEDELKKIVLERHKSFHVISTKVDPRTLLEEGQEIIYSSQVWKLNFGAKLDEPKEWLERTMWLTNSGGLFYYSSRFKTSLGRPVSEFKVVNNENQALGRWLLELYTMDDVSYKMPTVLAVETKEERNEWLTCLAGFLEGASDVLHSTVDPLERVMERSNSLTRVRNPNSGTNVRTNVRRNSGAQFFAHSIAKNPALPLGRQLSLGSKGSGIGGALAFGVVASQHGFDEKGNSVLVLDWDDTLFPTSFLREDCGLNMLHSIHDQLHPGGTRDELERLLESFAVRVEAFLDLAVSLANVVVVTLARRPWVTKSSSNFVPRIHEALLRHQIEIVYTREKMSEEMLLEDVVGMFKTQEEEVEFWTRGKATAMKDAIEAAYAKSCGSWKNIISFGDSMFEQLALQRVAADHMTCLSSQHEGHLMQEGPTSVFLGSDGQVKRLRTKTLKMFDEPTLNMLNAQISLLTEWLPHIVARDEGIDIEIPDVEDDASITKMDHLVTGRRNELTWLGLAGLDAEGNLVDSY